MPGPACFDVTAYSDDDIRHLMTECRIELVKRRRAHLRETLTPMGAVGWLSDVIRNNVSFDDEKFNACRDVLVKALPTCKKLVERATDAVGEHSIVLDDYENSYGVGDHEVEASFNRAQKALDRISTKLRQKETPKK